MGEVPELHQPAGRDRFAQEREQARVEPRPRTRAHGKALGLDEGFELGLDPGERFRTQGRANLRRELTERVGSLLESGLLEGRGGGFELRELFRRDCDEPANGVRPKAPTVLCIIGIHALKATEHVPDRVAHALRGAPADGEVGLNVLKRQPAVRSPEAARQGARCSSGVHNAFFDISDDLP